MISVQLKALRDRGAINLRIRELKDNEKNGTVVSTSPRLIEKPSFTVIDHLLKYK